MKNILMAFLPLCIFVTIRVNAQRTVPVFQNKDDSIKYEQIMSLYKDFSKLSRKNLDSLNKIMHALPIGFKYQYVPSHGYVSLEKALASSRPDTIYSVYLEGKKYTHLPRDLKNFSNLERLELVNTSVKKIPRWLNKNRSLNHLSLSNNQPQGYKYLVIKRNTSIRKLNIRGTAEQYMIRHLAGLKKLEEGVLFDCKLDDLPGRLHKNKHLNELRFNKCSFKEPITFKGKKDISVQKLVFLECSLRQFPQNLSRFKNLRSLQLAKNAIETIPPEIAELEKLENLSFYNNKIKEIPEELYQLQNLEELDLYYNEISVIDAGIAQLQNLKILYLSHNQLYSLPESIGQLNKLRAFYIHHNRLSYLPESIRELRGLQIFHFNNNYFQAFPEQVLELHRLKELNIAANGFTELPLSRFRFPYLKNLYIFHNPFEEEFTTSDTFGSFINKLKSEDVNVKY